MWFAAYNAALDREECAAELYALTVDVSASRRPSFHGS
jgi:hypothetical protein